MILLAHRQPTCRSAWPGQDVIWTPATLDLLQMSSPSHAVANVECWALLSAGHCGPVYGLTRNPFYPKFFLSAGDWSVRVWNEDLRTPVITSRYMPAHLTGSRWSPSRCALNCHPSQPVLRPT